VLERTASDERGDTNTLLDSLFGLLACTSGAGTDSDDSNDNDDYTDNDDEDGGMDADDYHNKAVACARRDQYKRAVGICMEGLKHYPTNVDLLSDTIKYSCNCGDMSAAGAHYMMLRKLPFRRWNWRAFTFSCDYLLANNPVENETELRTLLAQYKELLPSEEKAYVSESELEEALGNHDRSMEVLARSIQCHSNASQSALKLADQQFERGMFADVMDTCNYGLAASVEPQPSINVPYLLLLRVMSKDHLLHRKAIQETVHESEVQEIRDEYKLLLEEFPRQMLRFAEVIRERRSVLKFVSCED
jgi:tetratricopeptide (TPR) repeat protein